MILEKLRETIVKSYEPKDFDGTWSVTDCTGCPRAMVHQARKCLKRGIPSPEVIQRMLDGILHESDILAMLRLSGYKLYKPEPVHFPDLPVIGHPDAFIDISGVKYGLEIKTYDKSGFNGLTTQGVKEYSPGYYNQMQLYMHGTEPKRWIFLAKCRDDGRYHEEVVSYDRARVRELVTNIQAAKATLDSDMPCEQMPCSDDFMTRLFCPYQDVLCEAPGLEITDNMVNKAAESYKYSRDLIKQAEQEIEYAKDIFLSILDTRQVDKIDIPKHGLRVYASGIKRRYGDIEVARNILDPETLDRIFPVKETPGPRIYNLKGGQE